MAFYEHAQTMTFIDFFFFLLLQLAEVASQVLILHFDISSNYMHNS